MLVTWLPLFSKGFLVETSEISRLQDENLMVVHDPHLKPVSP